MDLAALSQKVPGLYSPAFHAALLHVLKFEGGWSDHAEDPGGKTYRGITLKLLKQWRNNPSVTGADLKAITAEEVYQIYHQMFWKAVNGDQLPAPIASMLFDAAVNSGPRNAILALQRSVNAWAAIPFKMREDGVIGPKTTAAAAKADQAGLTREYLVRRIVFYGLLTTFRTFGLGWIRRVIAGHALAQKLITAGKALAEALPERKDL